MKKILLAAVMCLVALVGRAQEEEGMFATSDLKSTMAEGDKAALLVVSFGTTYDDTRSKTIDAVNAKAAERFPELEHRDAYTSRIVIKRLKRRGIEKSTPLEALFRLRAEGYTHVIVQSTNIIDGAEMESLRRDVEQMQPFFKEVRIGTPLLYSVDDMRTVLEILIDRLDGDNGNNRKAKEHFVLVGHGTYTPSTAIYSQADYMLKTMGKDNWHVGTIEGYPTFDDMLQQLKDAKARRVTLVPFMFVAGDHANNDIAVEWKQRLEQEGFEVSALIEGLGEVPEIQEIYLNHIQYMLTHRNESIVEKKARYSANDK